MVPPLGRWRLPLGKYVPEMWSDYSHSLRLHESGLEASTKCSGRPTTPHYWRDPGGRREGWPCTGTLKSDTCSAIGPNLCTCCINSEQRGLMAGMHASALQFNIGWDRLNFLPCVILPYNSTLMNIILQCQQEEPNVVANTFSFT